MHDRLGGVRCNRRNRSGSRLAFDPVQPLTKVSKVGNHLTLTLIGRDSKALESLIKPSSGAFVGCADLVHSPAQIVDHAVHNVGGLWLVQAG